MNNNSSIRDQKDFEAIYDSYYERIYNYSYMLLLNKEDAEDVTEDTFLAAYRSFDSFDPDKASIGTWLSRIAHNRAVNLMRSSAYSKKADIPETWDIQQEGDFTEDLASSDVILKLYSKLTPEEREFLNLRYVVGLKDREIASLLSLGEKTVNKRYQRLLTKCRSLMD